jgi:hypothetical protein
MLTYAEHLKKILVQFVDSYNILKEFQDKPGDLDKITKELLKINGFLKVITKKVDPDKIPISDFKPLKLKFQNYLDNYYFEKEIETMAPLYFDDIYRIKNMRLKILEALEDKKMMFAVDELIEKL